MRKRFSLLVFILAMVMAVASASVAFAANASLSVSGGGSYTKGSTVTIRYTYSGSSISGATSQITYDSSVLQYVSCSGGVAPGSASGVFSVQAGDGNDHTSMSVTLTFKAIGTGSTRVSVGTSDLIDYDGNALNCPSSSTTVTVTNPAPSVSSNANLSAMTASAGSLSPAFSPGRTSYTVYADKDETVCLISVDTEDPNATVEVTGSKDLIIGSNVRKVIVTAPSGNTKTYTITIYRGDTASGDDSSDNEDDSEDKDDNKKDDKDKEEIKVTVGEKEYSIEEDIKSEDVPDEFRLVVGKYEGKDIPLVKDNDLNYTLALLKDGKTGDKKWFFYDEKNGNFSKNVSLSAEDALKYAKLSALEKKSGSESFLDNNEKIVLLVLGGTLIVLFVAVIVLQIKIIRGRKHSKDIL